MRSVITLACGLMVAWIPLLADAVAGAGVYLLAPKLALQGATWREVEEYGDARLDGCRVFMLLPGPLQTLQRAEIWHTIMALQASGPGHLGLDNLDVVRAIAKLLDHGTVFTPLPLVKDGDLIAVVRNMILARGPEAVRISKVKGHATEADVEQGGVLAEDKCGNAETDTAADWGDVISLRRLWISSVPWLVLGATCVPSCCSCTSFFCCFSGVC